MSAKVTRRDTTYVLLMIGIVLAALGLPWLIAWTHPLPGAVLIVVGVALAPGMRVRRNRAGPWP